MALTAKVSGELVWSRQRLGSIDGVKVAWCSRGMTVEAANEQNIGRSGELWYICG